MQKTDFQEFVQFLDSIWKPWFEAKFEAIAQKIDHSNSRIDGLEAKLISHDMNIKELYGRVTIIENKESKLEGGALGIKTFFGIIIVVLTIIGGIIGILQFFK